MDEESKNWFRLSKLIIDVGPNILRNFVAERAQACFVNDLEKCWHEKVEAIYKANFVSLQWTSFMKELYNKDDVLQTTLKPLLNSWNCNSIKELTFSAHVLTLTGWKNDIEKRLHDGQTQDGAMLLSWLKQIETRICHLNDMPPILQSCTTEFFELCQLFRHDLVRKFKEHYDDFLLLCRRRVSSRRHLTKGRLYEKITRLKKVRKKTQETWNGVLENYFQLLGEGIKRILTSWKQKFPSIDDIPELKDLFNGFATDANSVDRTRLLESCDTWHLELDDLFNSWLKKTDKELNQRMLNVGSFVQELKLFPSISLQQVEDLLKSMHSILKRETSKQQMSKLFPKSGFANLQKCDTSLLFIVLKSGLVPPPMEGWYEDPPQSDQSLGADILRLKSYRNDIVGHIEKTKIDRWEFDVLWKSVQGVLCRLASRLGPSFETEVRTEIDKIKSSSFNSNSEREFQRILQWCRNDILAEFRGIAELNQSLNVLKEVERIQRERRPNLGGDIDIFAIIRAGVAAMFLMFRYRIR